MIGWWSKSSRYIPKRICPYHHRILIPKQENGIYETGVLQCPECGTPFLEHEAPTDENNRKLSKP